MINIKKLTALLVTMMIMVVSAVPLSASADTANKDKGYIFDLDDSLSDSQEDALEKQLEELSKKSAMNVAVVISDDLDGKNQVAYADDYYDSLFGINTDGILLLLNNYNQIDHISTSGDRIIKLYDQDYMNHMFDKMSPSLKAGDYDRAIGIFLEHAYPSAVSRYNFMNGTVKFAGIGLIAGAVISLITCLIIAHGYKTNKKCDNRNYIVQSETNFTVKEDRYLRQYTTKVKLDNNSGSSRSGGGTHRSSSGGTHGGMSRRR